MGYIADIYTMEQTSPTMTDRYHFTTGYGYWVEGRADNPAILYIYGRKEAEGGGYTVEAGLEGIIDIIKRWKDYGLTGEDRQWLADQGYPDEYIEYVNNGLKDGKDGLKIQVDACKTKLFFPQEPVVRIKGPMSLIKMLESVNLCLENGQAGYATHGARMAEVLEADMESGAPKGGASVQGLRRGPALGAALEASRGLSYGGYKSTSTGRAAEMQGTRFAGTMDHAWVESHLYQLNKEPGAPTMKDLFRMKEEGRVEEYQSWLWKDAFRAYAFTNPNNGILLTDTYDTPGGIEDAITVIKELRELGLGKNYGMRFDSGDLTGFSKLALLRLAERNENGDLLDALPPDIDVSKLSNKDLLLYAEKSSEPPFCSASDGIDVYTAQQMRRDGAYVRSWGVGTGGSHVKPVGLVQKLAAFYMKPLNGKPVPEGETLTPLMKIVSGAPAKSSNPGNINSRRFYDDHGKLSHIVIFDEDLGFDPKNEIVNLRDFSEKKINPGGASFYDILEPVFDAEGRYVYQEPPKKPDHPGSSYMVTDLDHAARDIKAELNTLPDDVRRIERPRDEVLSEMLMKEFAKARKEGRDVLSVNIHDIEQQLPPPQAHVPIYLDGLLYEQRVACEQKHLHKATVSGVGTYNERFEHK
ncbi:MAG TPA: hypothetical protein VL625_06920 [Patescibacteria group bacterium]|jgi:nicotinate phosphoribosyltransferase|nr:hypothetical protein [Patescibacteria group bacterium]